jgi:hypothetical protein
VTRGEYALYGLLIAGAVLSGCGGSSAGAPGAPPVMRGAHPAGEARNASGRGQVLFVADLSKTVVYFTANIHAKNPPRLGQISDGIVRASGVWIDREGTLYVTNFDSSIHSLVEYKRGDSAPFKTITNGLFTPGAVAVDRSGNVYVADFEETVLYYAAGADSPAETIQIPRGNHTGIVGLAFDPKGNLLVGTAGVEGAGNNAVYSVVPGSWKVTNLDLQSPPGGAIGSDRAGNIFAGGVSGYISVYPPGAQAPSRSINAGTSGFYSDLVVTANGTIYWPNYQFGGMYEFASGASSPTNVFSGGNGVDAAVGPW